MKTSRNYLLMGTLYLIGGVLMGSYMGATNDHTLVPVHAHANLLGFTLMMLFGIVFRVIPAMGASVLAPVQFWLHQIGTLVMLLVLGLFLAGKIGESWMMLMPVAEITLLGSVLVFLVNLIRNGSTDQFRAAFGAEAT